MHKGIQSVRTIDDEMAQLIEIYGSLVSEDTN